MKFNISLLLSAVFAIVCLYFTVVDLKAFLMTYSAFSLFLGVVSGVCAYWNAKNVMLHLSKPQQ